MSTGLPIISTNTPFGPAEILGRGAYGILVQMDSPLHMKEAIENLLTNKSKYEYFSKKSLERYVFFSKSKMISQYWNVINDVLNLN